MKNKYLINFSKKFWFYFWQKLMDGFAPSDKQGNYIRPKGLINNKKYNINRQNGEIFLILGSSCPWCHRALLIHEFRRLSNSVKIIFLKPDINNAEWMFKERFNGSKTLNEFYKKDLKSDFFRATVPLLISKKNKEIKLLSNESLEIIKILNSIKKKNKVEDTQKVNDCDQKLINLIHSDINNGVYKCGFARNQSSYDFASQNLFKALEKINLTLEAQNSKWICGDNLTYADICLFPTLIRWELIYSKLFRCTAKEISVFQSILKWRLRFFKLSKVSQTCIEDEWKRDYYKALFPLNPNQIIPDLPLLKEIISMEIK